MAILNSLEGSAHVEANSMEHWNGYILLDPTPIHITSFDIAGPQSKAMYEGPIVLGGQYYFSNGGVRIRQVNFTPTELRVDFVGVEKLNIIRPLSAKPDDYLS